MDNLTGVVKTPVAEVASSVAGTEIRPLATIRVEVGLSIIIPTYREAANIPLILARISALRQKHNLLLEVLFMDDNSQDGSVEAVKQSGFDWAKIIVRTENRGLSPA